MITTRFDASLVAARSCALSAIQANSSAAKKCASQARLTHAALMGRASCRLFRKTLNSRDAFTASVARNCAALALTKCSRNREKPYGGNCSQLKDAGSN